jgi:hypothetical protein
MRIVASMMWLVALKRGAASSSLRAFHAKRGYGDLP